MQIDRGKISSLQFMFLTAGFIQGSVNFIAFADSLTHHDSWLAILSAYFISIPFVLSYVFLSKRFPGKSLVQINAIIYGPYLGPLISILYIAFFLLLLSFNLIEIANYYNTFIMTETPVPVFVIIFVLACAYAVRHGIEVMARVSFTLLLYGVFVVTTTFALLLKDMDFSNFLPILEIPLKTFIQGTHIMVAIPFCDIVALLMVMPSLNNYKKIAKYTLWGLTISASLLFLIAVRNTAVLGPTALILVSASMQSIRLIDIGNFLTRVDLLIAFGIAIALFLKISILYYAVVMGISQVLRLRSYLPLILPLGSIAIILAMIAFESSIYEFNYALRYHAIYTIPFELVIPPLSLLIAKIRGLPVQTEGESR